MELNLKCISGAHLIVLSGDLVHETRISSKWNGKKLSHLPLKWIQLECQAPTASSFTLQVHMS